jgi:two-component sensor histidine kinase
MLKSIYNRILILLLLLVVTIFGSLFIFRFYNRQTLKHYTLMLGEEKKRLLSRVVDSVGEKLRLISFDYSYWDEMVEFVSTGSEQWAAENLDTAMITYDVHALWVLNPDLAEVHRVSSVHATDGKPYSIPDEVLEALVQGRWFNHFYTVTAEGILELRTAPIQPSSDAKRVTRPRGFFITGRLWTPEILKGIGTMTESDVEVLSFDALRNDTQDGAHPSRIQVSISLPGRDGKEIARVYVRSESELVVHLLRSEDVRFFFMLVFSLVVIGLISLFLFRTLNIPLRLITRSLRQDDAGPIRALVYRTSEFGGIARLMLDFFEHRAKLKQEILRRSQAEEEIRTALTEKEVLLREIHHRVRNNLQLLQSLMVLQQNYCTDENAQKELSSAVGRIHSMSLVHDGLYHQEMLSRISLDEYIPHLCRDLQDMQRRSGKVVIEASVSPISVNIETAVPLGLIFNELIKNALEHAFSQEETGKIAVTIRKDNDAIFASVEDFGRGIPDPSVFHNSDKLGLQLVHILTRQLQGTIEIEKGESTKINLRIPLS